MTEAEQSVRRAAEKISPEICSRFKTAAKLDAKDRLTIIEIARQALVPFLDKTGGKNDAAKKEKS
jgi:hypothetical protein